MDENQVLELVEFYEDMIEKQDEIIVRQSRFIKSLATELSHLRNMLNVEASEDERLDAGIIEEVKEEYVSMRGCEKTRLSFFASLFLLLLCINCWNPTLKRRTSPTP